MDSAWTAFPLSEREHLRALPWENDPEPAELGTWVRGQMAQNGKPVLRPALRQCAPDTYVGDSVRKTSRATGGDWHGAAFVRDFLLPASARVLPLLVAAVRRVADETAADPARDVFVPLLKTALRMDEKAGTGFLAGTPAAAEADHYLHEYPRQASNVDVARVMLVLPTPMAVVHALRLFKEKCEVARVKNRFSPAAPLYGYRDMLLNLKIDGVYCEVQLGLAPLVAVRKRMHKYYGIVRSVGMSPLVSMAKPLTSKLPSVGDELVAEATAARALVESSWSGAAGSALGAGGI